MQNLTKIQKSTVNFLKILEQYYPKIKDKIKEIEFQEDFTIFYYKNNFIFMLDKDERLVYDVVVHDKIITLKENFNVSYNGTIFKILREI